MTRTCAPCSTSQRAAAICPPNRPRPATVTRLPRSSCILGVRVQGSGFRWEIGVELLEDSGDIGFHVEHGGFDAFLPIVAETIGVFLLTMSIQNAAAGGDQARRGRR